jgi:hypothetical protein
MNLVEATESPIIKTSLQQICRDLAASYQFYAGKSI